jgi:hypothetical protein
MIFELLAARDSEVLMDVITVCKRWYNIAVNAPRLWTQIFIIVEPSEYERLEGLRDKGYVHACLRRSASLPLHITLNLTDMRPYQHPGQKHRDVLGTISLLVGISRIHMSRWKTLKIFLPRYEEAVRAIWQLFDGATPQLVKLLVRANTLSRMALVSPTQHHASFSDLSLLADLTLEGPTIDMDFLGLNFPSVRTLDMQTDIRNSPQISRFTHLEYLDILFTQFPFPTISNSALKPIHLPLLRRLTFHVYGSTRVEWHVPVLQRLKIVGSLNDESKAPPNVRALHVRWTLGLPNYTTEPRLLPTLQTIISKYNDTQELSIHTSLKPIWEKYMQDLSEDKRLVLPTVSFYK